MLQIPIEERKEILKTFVDECEIPHEKQIAVLKTLNGLADLYEGSDSNVIGVLWRAMEKSPKQFDKYAKKLQDYYAVKVKQIPVEARSLVFGKDTGFLVRR